MSRSDDIRKKIAQIAAKRAAVERQHGEASARQAAKNAEHARRQEQAGKASSDGMRRSHLRQAEQALKAALAEGKKIAQLSKKRAEMAKDEGAQQKALGEAIKREAADQEAKAKRERQAEDRRRADEKRADERRRREQRRADERRAEQLRLEDQLRTDALLGSAEQRLSERIDAALRPPKKEELRILYATANSGGDLIRVDEEIRRVKAVVRSATHRDQVAVEHLPAATPGDLLDGLTSFRPHVVHFSGHADETVLVFDDGSPSHGPGRAVTADAFKRAMEAPDTPPVLVVLNACNSAAHLRSLLGKVAVAIGMSDSIGDADALVFATRFYGSLAEGQSVAAALATARVDMEMNGLPDHDLPALEALRGIDPSLVHLVKVPH